ncbi:ABC transporter permease [Neisseria sp. Ec49-e6-T10]|uniref:ABC transporter permease n=1 Tax=Neisseria sp. Ec49-e6-T10 TaxID=3140744 RepID=UPI003EB76823
MINPVLFWRFVLRQLRSKELSVLCVAFILAVCAASCVLFFSFRLEQTLAQEASKLIAADLVVVSDQAGDEYQLIKKQVDAEPQLHSAQSATFQSMLMTDQGARLVRVIAVSDKFPLKGENRIQVSNKEQTGTFVPKNGQIWVDQQLASQLHLKEQQRVHVGDKELLVEATLLESAASGLELFNLLPTAMMNLSDLPQTGLVQEGSRIRYRLFITGPTAQLEQLKQTLMPNLPRGMKLETIDSARPEVQNTLVRANRFLGFATSLSVILSIVALSLTSTRYLSKHVRQVAIMRTLGSDSKQIFRLFLGLFVFIGLICSVLGTLLGFVAQEFLLFSLKRVFDSISISTFPIQGLTLAVLIPFVATILLLLLILPQIISLKNSSTLNVLRGDLPTQNKQLLSVFMFILVVVGSSAMQIGDLKLTAQFLAGVAVLFVVMSFVSILLLKLCKCVITSAYSFAWQGLADVARRPKLSLIQMVSLSVSLMALLTLTFVKNDLVDAWKQRIPDNAPNYFILGVQKDQTEALNQFFNEHNIPTVKLSAMTRARLVKVNQQEITENTYTEENAKRLAEREFNLSWGQTIPEHNQVVQGQFWSKDNADPAFSVEEGLVETLKLKLGDVLTFDIAGQEYQAPITNLRKLNWESMQVNFFVIGNGIWLEDAPASFIASFYLASEQTGFINQATEVFPNISFIDVGNIIREMQKIIDRLTYVVNAVFVLCLMASVIVLWASVLNTRDERLFDAALMRSLGAQNQQIRRRLFVELWALGAFSGLLAGLFALALEYFSASLLLDLEPKVNLLLLLVGIIAGVLCTTLSGYPILRNVLKVPPNQILNQR